MAFCLICNGTLIDGKGGEPLADAAVLIEDNRIRAVGSARDVALPDADITEIDAEGGFILPGFIDTHVHLMLEGIDLMHIMATPFSFNFYQAIEYMRRTVAAGVTSVRDAAGADAGVKQAVEQGLVLGPRMQISITNLSITGGHGDDWMLSGNKISIFQPYPGRPDGRCDGPDEVRKKSTRSATGGCRGNQGICHWRRAEPDRPSRIYTVLAGRTEDYGARSSLPAGRQSDGACPRR